MNNLTDNNWILSVGTFLPLLGALVIMFGTSKDDERTPKIIGIVTAGATLAIGIVTLVLFDYDQAQDLQFFVDAEWIEVISSGYTIGLDGISLPLYFLSMAVTFLVMIYSWDNMPDAGNPKAFYSLMLILQTGMAGTFIAQDLILFFVFFEVVLLPMYFMIGVWGGEQTASTPRSSSSSTRCSARRSCSSPSSHCSSRPAAESFGFAWLVRDGCGHRPRRPDLDLRRHVPRLRGQGADVPVPHLAARRAHAGAHAGLGHPGRDPAEARHVRLRAHRHCRCCPQGAQAWAPVIGILAVIGIIYGALGCLAQTDMKRLIAFSSVAHMGFVMLGISTLTEFGINAALFGMVAHGLITGMLFFVAGSIKHRYHTLEIKRLSGMLIQMPKMGWILGFAAMASLGLPGLAGFWGEFPAILSAYNPHPALNEALFRTLMVIAAIGTVLAAAYLLWLYQRTAFGEPDRRSSRATPTPSTNAGTVRRTVSPTRSARPRTTTQSPRRPRGDPRRAAHRVDRLDAVPHRDRRVRCVPAADVQGARPGRHRTRQDHLGRHPAMIGLVSSLLAQAEWTAPAIDWHAIAPELILVIGINLVLFIDLNIDESKKWMIATLTGFVMLAAFIPVVTLGLELDGVPREMFDGRYVIDEYALVLKALFLLVGYVVVLMSQNELEEGGYYQGEFYVLMLCSVLGMVMMTSARDLISIFVALELLSIPAYMMAAWRKRVVDVERGGRQVLPARCVRLGDHALRHVVPVRHDRNRRKLTEIGAALTDGDLLGLEVVGVVFVIVGFAFKVSAVPFHTWAPDTYEGAPTPVTAFLSVASKAAGFVALVTLIYRGVPERERRLRPVDLGDGGAHDDRRQRARPAPDQHRSHARLLLGQPGWLHPDAARVRR